MKTVVMTGGTSGLGEVAARRIAAGPETRLLLGARPGPGRENTIPLDLTRLASVREFAEAVRAEAGADGIDVLVLNAGTQFARADTRTEDGFETTFAVNHLAHYLLLRLLLPSLAPGATVVITTSDTHDPEVIRVGAPRSLDPEALARPAADSSARFGSGFRAYAASKLCNLLTARSLDALRHFTVVAYNPGLTPGTGLVREHGLLGQVITAVTKAAVPLARLATVEQAGDALADLALGRAVPPPGRVYASLVKRRLTWPDPSVLARRDDVRDQLWTASAAMTGLDTGAPGPGEDAS